MVDLMMSPKSLEVSTNQMSSKMLKRGLKDWKKSYVKHVELVEDPPLPTTLICTTVKL
jgi:hypothetical protein